MNNIEEKRNAMRMDVSCEIYCKLSGSEALHKALCVCLSGSGISFISDFAFEIGANVEVLIQPETTLVAPMDFFVTVVRCQANENGEFTIGARIQLPSENNEPLP